MDAVLPVASKTTVGDSPPNACRVDAIMSLCRLDHEDLGPVRSEDPTLGADVAHHWFDTHRVKDRRETEADRACAEDEHAVQGGRSSANHRVTADR